MGVIEIELIHHSSFEININNKKIMIIKLKLKKEQNDMTDEFAHTATETITITSIRLDFGHRISGTMVRLVNRIRPNDCGISTNGWMSPSAPAPSHCYHWGPTIACWVKLVLFAFFNEEWWTKIMGFRYIPFSECGSSWPNASIDIALVYLFCP